MAQVSPAAHACRPCHRWCLAPLPLMILNWVRVGRWPQL